MKQLVKASALALSLVAASAAHAGGVAGGNANSNWTIYGCCYDWKRCRRGT